MGVGESTICVRQGEEDNGGGGEKVVVEKGKRVAWVRGAACDLFEFFLSAVRTKRYK